jgi:hypothetical protein
MDPSFLRWFCHNNFNRRTHIIIMIILTLDKLTSIKARPLESQSQGCAGLYSVTGWDNTYQKALYPRMPAIVHRLEQVATWLPHVARGSFATMQNGSALRQIIGTRVSPPLGKAV